MTDHFDSLVQQRRGATGRDMSRRRFLRSVGVTGGALAIAGSLGSLLAACGGDDDDDTSATSTTTSGGGTSATPGDGTAGTDASTPETSDTEGEPKRGGTLKAAMQVDVTHLDPHFGDSYSSTLVTEQVYEGLVQFDPEMTVQPNLATDWEVSADGLEYTFTLKQGVTFHNGRALVPDDVVYSINRVADPDGGSTQQYLLASVKETTAVDEQTVTITLNTPFAPLLNELPAIFIVPKEVVEEQGDLRTTAVGTGPFTFVEFVPNSHVSLKRNENYHVEGLPYLDGIEWSPIPDDTTRTANIKTGSIDFADQIPQKDIDPLGDEDGIVLASGPSTLNDFLILNTTREPLDDVRVRQAIAWTIDRQAMTDTILFGHGRPIDGGVIPDWSWAYSDLHVYTAPDIEKAKQLMKDAGLEDGFDLTIGAGASYHAQVQAAEVIADQLKQININVTPNPQEWATYIDQTINPKNFDAAIIGWIGAIDPDDALYPQFTPKGSFDQSGYDNPEVADLLDQGRQLQTPEERKPIYNQAEAIIVEECPVVFFYFYDQYEALRDHVKGYQHMANSSKLTFKQTWLDK